MQTSNNREAYMYILVGAIGALLGGVMVLVASNALPKMMSSFMSGMMSNLMMGVGEEGCSPVEN
jgi:putative flippase GtrA